MHPGQSPRFSWHDEGGRVRRHLTNVIPRRTGVQQESGQSKTPPLMVTKNGRILLANSTGDRGDGFGSFAGDPILPKLWPIGPPREFAKSISPLNADFREGILTHTIPSAK